MSEITTGWRSILSAPRVYEVVQALAGSEKFRRAFVDQHIRPGDGVRILDIGCGPADILRSLPGNAAYVGYDISPHYIERARQRYPGRGQFITANFTAAEVDRYEPFDIALLLGVLHHLDDHEATELFLLLRRAVRAGGRVVTIDPVFANGQNPIARKLIEWDRGQNVRTGDGFAKLAQPFFSDVQGTLVHQSFIPYTHWIMECS